MSFKFQFHTIIVIVLDSCMDRSNTIDQVQEQIQESIGKRVYFTSLRGGLGACPREILWHFRAQR